MLNVVASVATVLAVLFGLFYIWAKWKLTYWQRRGVPTLPTNLLTGNFKDCVLQRISAGFMLGRLHLEAKPDTRFLGVYIFQKPVLIIRDPDLIKQILVRDAHIFCNRYFGLKNGKDILSTQNLFSIDNPPWRYLRMKLSPAFSSGKIKGLFKLMVESSESLTSYLDGEFKDYRGKSKSIEVKNASARYTTDVISSLAFGIRTNSFNKETSEFYTNSRIAFPSDFFSALALFCIFFFPKFADFLDRPIFADKTAYFRDIFWRSMKAREESRTERGDVMDILLKLKEEDQNGEFKFEEDRLVAQSTIFFIAGLETSATTIAFGLYELAKQPDLQERVREEILEILNDGGLTYENVQKMKYLTKVINETLRLYPPAPILDRVAEEDYKIPGTDVIIEKRTPLYVALPGLHMDPKYFSNPDTFDPERFNEDNKIEPYTYLPFGGGPRVCVGMRVGSLQTAVGFIQILRGYRVTVNPAYKTEVNRRNVFLETQNGAHLFFERIES